MNLRTHLMLQIVLTALLCFAMAAGYVLWSGQREARRNAEQVLDLMTRQLQAQLIKTAAGFDQPERFPYLDALLESGLLAGWCVKYVDREGQITQSSCREDRPQRVPSWFAAAYRATFDSGQEIGRELSWRGEGYGRVSAIPNSEVPIGQVWGDVRAMLGLTAITLLALCLLVYFRLTRALRPTDDILVAIERLERGDLSARLPHCDLLELRKMSTGFNRMAASLEESRRERTELMRKLVNVQEQERRFLARELHDELGQCIAAVNASASIILHTASQDCPELVAEGDRLARTGAHMMDMLQGMLRRLRPIGIEELGLVRSIQGLAAQWKSARMNIDLELEGNLEELPEAMNVAVFRIVQECLTNVSKHARASNVRVRLQRREPGHAQHRPPEGGVEVLVEDDGVADPAAFELAPSFGVLGMRERVAALGGELTLQARPSKGLSVRALLPLGQAA